MEFFQTERLILRNVRPEDVPVIHDYRNNDLCARYQRGQVRDLAGIEALVEKRRNDILSTQANCLLAIAEKDSDDLVGEILIMPNDGCFSLGYTVSYRHHRKGYAFEALSVLIEALHASYPDWEFISFTEPENIASIALLQKLGYTHLCYSEKLESEVFGKWVKDI